MEMPIKDLNGWRSFVSQKPKLSSRSAVQAMAQDACPPKTQVRGTPKGLKGSPKVSNRKVDFGSTLTSGGVKEKSTKKGVKKVRSSLKGTVTGPEGSSKTTTPSSSGSFEKKVHAGSTLTSGNVKKLSTKKGVKKGRPALNGTSKGPDAPSKTPPQSSTGILRRKINVGSVSSSGGVKEQSVSGSKNSPWWVQRRRGTSKKTTSSFKSLKKTKPSKAKTWNGSVLEVVQVVPDGEEGRGKFRWTNEWTLENGTVVPVRQIVPHQEIVKALPDLSGKQCLIITTLSTIKPDDFPKLARLIYLRLGRMQNDKIKLFFNDGAIICEFAECPLSKGLERLHGQPFQKDHLMVQKYNLEDHDQLVTEYCIRVTNLSAATTKKTLWEFFESCGKLGMIYLNHDTSEALINFEASDSVVNALQKDGADLDSAKIKVEHLNLKKSVKISNLHPDTTNESIRQKLKGLKPTFISTISDTVKIAYASFSDEKSYSKALTLNGKEWFDQSIVVTPALEHNKVFTQWYPEFGSLEELSSAFESFGSVKRVYLHPRIHGVCVIAFESKSGVKAALRASSVSVNDRLCNISDSDQTVRMPPKMKQKANNAKVDDAKKKQSLSKKELKRKKTDANENQTDANENQTDAKKKRARLI